MRANVEALTKSLEGAQHAHQCLRAIPRTLALGRKARFLAEVLGPLDAARAAAPRLKPLTDRLVGDAMFHAGRSETEVYGTGSEVASAYSELLRALTTDAE